MFEKEKHSLKKLKKFSKEIDRKLEKTPMNLYNEKLAVALKYLKGEEEVSQFTPYFAKPFGQYPLSDYLMDPALLSRAQLNQSQLGELNSVADQLKSKLEIITRHIGGVRKIL